MENTYVVFSSSPVRLLHCCWNSPAPPRPLRPDEASPAAAPPPPRPGPSSLPELRFQLSLGLVREESAIRFQERSRPRDTSSDRSHDRGISGDHSHKRFAYSDHSDSLQGIPLLL